MIKVKSDRPLLFNGVPQTEFETTEHHARELKAAGLAVPVEVETEAPVQAKTGDDVPNKMAPAPGNKTAKK